MTQENSNTTVDDLYSSFDMDEDSEVRGIPVNYGKFVVTIARVGGSNDLYRKVFERESKPVQAALEMGGLSEAESRQLLFRVFARSVVKNWQFRENGALLTGFGRDAKGEVVEFNEQNLIAIWTKRYELFLQIKRDAETRELYQSRVRESVAKN
jgi:hypothetical protein